MIKFTINIPPRTKKNSQQIITVKGRPIIIPSKLYRQYEKDCEPFIPVLRQPKPYIRIPVNLKCIYYMPTKRRVDLNNLLEATTDMLVHYGVLEDDNSNIVYSHDGSRVYVDRDNPRTEIYIERVDVNGD
jgi:Holliday junction resolvase RusA-like endonuclease